MFTLLTIPKPFRGHIDVIQRNALLSWKRLQPACEIILVGAEDGVERTAAELNVGFIPEVARTSLGTPLLNDAFAQVTQRAKHDLICYVNADIIILSNFLEAIRQISFDRYMMVGQRWDLDITEPLDSSSPHYEDALWDRVRREGKLHSRAGSDYFVFPKKSDLWRLPPFAVGRPAWDNWMITNARKRGIPVVDISPTVQVIHQNHDYRHVPQTRDSFWNGPEGDANRALANQKQEPYTLDDSSHELVQGEIRRLAPFRNRHPAIYRHKLYRSLKRIERSIRKRCPGLKAQ